MKRIALASVMGLLAVNVWTGGPLLALWIGSRVQMHSKTSMTIEPLTALVVFAALAGISVVLVKSLSVVSGAYDRAAGVGPGRRRHDSWVSVERRNFDEKPSLNTLERILVVVVIAAGLAFEIWFFFFSTSPIDGRSGRSAVPVAYQTVSTRSSPLRKNRSPIASAPSRPTRPAPIWTLRSPSSVQ